MKSNYKKLGPLIREINQRNSDLIIKKLLGVSISKKFIPSIANIIGTDLSTYKIVKKNQFAYGPVTSRNGDKISIALLQEDDCIVSSSYSVFEISDTSILDPEYLMMWFKRSEFDRYARFKSHGSVRELFDWAELCNISLPVPSIVEQKKFVSQYNLIQDKISSNVKASFKIRELISTLYRKWFIDFEFPISEEFASSIGQPLLKGKPYKSSYGKMQTTIHNNEEIEIPMGWNFTALQNVSKYINRGITPKYVENGGCIVLNQKCIRNDSIDFDFHKRHDDSLKKVADEKKLEKYDILVNSTGQGTLGRVALVKEIDDPMTVDTHITILRADKTLINPLYLWSIISCNTDYIENLAEGSTGQTELKRELLGAMEILNAPIIYQKQFSALVEPLINYSLAIEKQNPLMYEFKNLFLSRLVK